MNPVLVTTHLVDGYIRHIAWSPNNYFQDIINQHPLAAPVYRNFVTAVGQQINGASPIRYTYTDFHCNEPNLNRGQNAYFCVSNDHVVSPVFFYVNEVHHYVQNHPVHHTIYVAEHRFI